MVLLHEEPHPPVALCCGISIQLHLVVSHNSIVIDNIEFTLGHLYIHAQSLCMILILSLHTCMGI